MDKSKVREIAHHLMAKYGLHRWTFEFRNFKGRLGQCRHERVPGTVVIALSEFFVLMNEESKVVDTILHEIAHALIGPGHGHGPLWKATALELGCIPKACSKQAQMPPGRYQATCPACKKLFHRHRKVGAGRRYWCPRCGKVHGRLEFVEVACAPLLLAMGEQRDERHLTTDLAHLPE